MSQARDPLARLRAAAAAREASGLRRALRPRGAGDVGRGAMVDLASNDYLGMSANPQVTEAAAAAARRWGVGATGSRLVTGSTTLHTALESTLADDCGLAVPEPGAAVVRIGLGDPELAVTAQRICASHGVLVGCFRPPSVPAGGSCLRLTARAGLTDGDFDAAARALAAVRDHIRTASPAGRN
jgi:7-keto-8-aminopelargonate synthetase-like enzyme